MGMKQAKQVTEIAESLGWSVDVDSDSIEFRKASPAGEDFSFIILTEGLSGDAELADKILDYAYDFDAEEHIKMWVNAQGQVSGVPDIKTLVQDADAIKEMLDELAAAVSNDEYPGNGLKNNTSKIWMRLGISLSVTENEAKALLSGGDESTDLLRELIADGRFKPDGDSYIPQECVQQYSREHGMDFKDEVEFML